MCNEVLLKLLYNVKFILKSIIYLSILDVKIIDLAQSHNFIIFENVNN